MKRIIALILALVMVVSVCFALSSCDFGKNDDDKTDKTEETEKTKKKDKKKDKDKEETETESAEETGEETESETETETETEKETEVPVPVLDGNIVGKWSAFIEGKKMMSMGLEESSDSYDYLVREIDYEGGMNIIFAFNSDGSCDMILDEDSVREFYNQNLEKILEATFAMSDVELTVEEYFEYTQTTKEEMVEQMMYSMETSISSESSVYSLDGDVLTIDGSKFAIDLDADKLVIKDQVGGEDSGAFRELLPLTMDRIG